MNRQQLRLTSAWVRAFTLFATEMKLPIFGCFTIGVAGAGARTALLSFPQIQNRQSTILFERLEP